MFDDPQNPSSEPMEEETDEPMDDAA